MSWVALLFLLHLEMMCGQDQTKTTDNWEKQRNDISPIFKREIKLHNYELWKSVIFLYLIKSNLVWYTNFVVCIYVYLWYMLGKTHAHCGGHCFPILFFEAESVTESEIHRFKQAMELVSFSASLHIHELLRDQMAG